MQTRTPPQRTQDPDARSGARDLSRMADAAAGDDRDTAARHAALIEAAAADNAIRRERTRKAEFRRTVVAGELALSLMQNDRAFAVWFRKQLAATLRTAKDRALFDLAPSPAPEPGAGQPSPVAPGPEPSAGAAEPAPDTAPVARVATGQDAPPSTPVRESQNAHDRQGPVRVARHRPSRPQP